MLFLVSSICSLNHKYNSSLPQQMSVLCELKKAGHQLVFISHNKALIELKLIKREALGLEFDDFFSFYEMDIELFEDERVKSSWINYAEIAAETLYKKYAQADGYFVFGGLVSETAGHISTNNSYKFDKALKKKISNYRYTRIMMSRTSQILAYCSKNNVQIYHKYHDPAEMSFEQSKKYPCKEIGYHGYSYKDTRGLQIHRLDSQQYYMRFSESGSSGSGSCSGLETKKKK